MFDVKRKHHLSSLRRLLPISVLALASLAHAGHWQVTYTGGQADDTVDTWTYGFRNDGMYGAYGNNCSGTITAKFKWTRDWPTDTSTPPDHVYVLETCNAYGGSNGSSPPAPDADNGLGSPKTSNTANPAPGYYVRTASCTGTRITRKDSSSGEFEVTASPSAHGATSAGWATRPPLRNTRSALTATTTLRTMWETRGHLIRMTFRS